MNELEEKVEIDQFTSAVPTDIGKQVKTYGVSDQEKLQRALRSGKVKNFVLDVETLVDEERNIVFLPDPDFHSTPPNLKVINANATRREVRNLNTCRIFFFLFCFPHVN